MKVLIIPAWYSDTKDVASFIIDQTQVVIKKGVKVAVLIVVVKTKKQFITDFFKKPNTIVIENNITYLQINYYSLFPFHFFKLFHLQLNRINATVLKAIEKYEQENTKFNLIHLQSVCNNLTPAIGFYLSQKLSLPYLITEHYTSFAEGGARIFEPYSSKEKTTKIVQNSSLNLSVSDFAAKLHGSYFNSEFKILPNVVPDLFLTEKSTSSIKNDEFTFLSIGGITERKGFDILIDAFINSFRTIQNVNLIIVGKGGLKTGLIERVEMTGFSKRVRFIDSLERIEILRLMDESNVVVSASLMETFGLTLVEAFFRGLPVIASDSGGPKDFITNENGLLCKAGDRVDLEHKMNWMYENYKTYDKNIIRKSAIEKYSESAIGTQICQCYEEVVKRKKK
ncbi:MAG: glycosyltransferase family 4 protein [Flavobacterium sp.]|nr:glycosyltransferase family 4 protein [Flavobacterium sp.]